MTTPMRPVPDAIARWVTRRRWLRWCDALVAWLALWAATLIVLPPGSLKAPYVATIALVVGALIQPLRVRWRPVAGWVGLRVSRGLRAGDRAWYVGAREASLVVVTARHGPRLVIARAGLDEDEGMSVRRTRVFLLPAEGP
jgi:hypothetical protein